MPDSFDDFCSLWPGASPGGYNEGYASSHQLFLKMFFDLYNFSIISNLFDSNMPQARIIENVRTKCIIFGQALTIRVKNLNKVCLKNIQKALK